MFEGSKDNFLADIKENCSSSQKLLTSLKHSAEHHRRYKIYYSSMKIVDSIIQEKELMARNSEFDDIVDQDALQNTEDGYAKFILCFTFSTSESIAMWHMYGRKMTDNVMVSYSKDMLKEIIENNIGKSIRAGHFDGMSFKFIKPIEDFEIDMCDILYYDENSVGKYNIKRADSAIRDIDREIVDCLPPYIIKNYAWSYENECRLIIKVRIDRNWNQEINAVKLIIPDTVLNNIKTKGKIILSPSFKGNNKSYTTQPSKLTGKIKLKSQE